MTALVVASVLSACSATMLFKATRIVVSTARTQYRKVPTTYCTVLASGGASLGDSGDCCDSCGAVEPWLGGFHWCGECWGRLVVG